MNVIQPLLLLTMAWVFLFVLRRLTYARYGHSHRSNLIYSVLGLGLIGFLIVSGMVVLAVRGEWVAVAFLAIGSFAAFYTALLMGLELKGKDVSRWYIRAPRSEKTSRE